MTEQDKRQQELDKQLDGQLAGLVELVRKLEEVTEDNQLTMKETRFLIERRCLSY